MTTRVVADDLVGTSIIDRRHGIELRQQIGKVSLSGRNLALGQRWPFSPRGTDSIECPRDRIAGVLSHKNLGSVTHCSPD